MPFNKPSHPEIKKRISILIKEAEIIYREIEKISREDMIYYLQQIITDAKECLDVLNYKEPEPTVDPRDKL